MNRLHPMLSLLPPRRLTSRVQETVVKPLSASPLSAGRGRGPPAWPAGSRAGPGRAAKGPERQGPSAGRAPVLAGASPSAVRWGSRAGLGLKSVPFPPVPRQSGRESDSLKETVKRS